MTSERLVSLRVFGCLPVTARGAARRQASEKPRRRKPRGEYAPAAVSVYGDLRRGSARLGRSEFVHRRRGWESPALGRFEGREAIRSFFQGASGIGAPLLP